MTGPRPDPVSGKRVAMSEHADEERDFDDPDERETSGQTPGGAEPQTGERGPDEPQATDIPAGA